MSKQKILVVDDDEAVLEYLCLKVGARYDVIVTAASSEVMAIARESQPQLIVCDLDMPDMNGTQVSAAIFGDEELRHIPLMFLTGAIAPSDIRRVRGQVGGRPAVAKNAPLPELLERIEAMLASVSESYG